MRPSRSARNTRRAFVGTLLIAIALATTACGSTKSTSADSIATFPMEVTPTAVIPINDFYHAGPQVTFSTANGGKRPEQAIDLVNGTANKFTVTSVTILSPEFTLDSSTPKHFTLSPGSHRKVMVAFTPKTPGVTASNLSFSISGRSPAQVRLSGLNANGIESSNEPNLQEVFDALGYKDNVAMPTQPPADVHAYKTDMGDSISSAPSALGDEALTPTFTQADNSKPVTFVPLANYIARSKYVLGWFGINQAGSKTNTQPVLAFTGGMDVFGGENQQLLPGIGNGAYSGLVAGSSISFQPKFATFGIWDAQHSVFSQDALNRDNEHSIRIYPAVASTGEPIPNAYLIAEDSTDKSNYKNYDYQDFVFLITNVKATN